MCHGLSLCHVLAAAVHVDARLLFTVELRVQGIVIIMWSSQ